MEEQPSSLRSTILGGRVLSSEGGCSRSSPLEANPTYIATGFLSPAPDGIYWGKERVGSLGQLHIKHLGFLVFVDFFF